MRPKDENNPRQEKTGPSQVLNFLWLNLDLPAPPDPADGTIRQPLPENYIENVREAGKNQPQAQIVLWVDSKRLTARQYAYLDASISQDRSNVRLKDLRGIPAYDSEPLYNQAEDSGHWRADKSSLIWRQVDAAKALVSLQGDYDQTFFADLDHAHVDIKSPQVQEALANNGMLIGSAAKDHLAIENQLWGFTEKRRPFFETYYASALKEAQEGDNGWHALAVQVEKEFSGWVQIIERQLLLRIDGDGSQAQQPGHKWRGYPDSSKKKPLLVSHARLAKAFNLKKSVAAFRTGAGAKTRSTGVAP